MLGCAFGCGFGGIVPQAIPCKLLPLGCMPGGA